MRPELPKSASRLIHAAGVVTELMSPRGLLLRRDVVAHGYDDKCLLRLVKCGAIKRIRQGAYADAGVWSDLDPRARHSLLTDAVVRQYDDSVAISHDSAVVRLGGPDYGLDLSSVHVTHFAGGGRRGARVVHHEGCCTVLDVTRVQDHWLTSPARTVVDIAAVRGLETGVVVADDFIRRGLTDPHQIRQLHTAMSDRPHTLAARMVPELATGKSESVGESLGWLLFRSLMLPRPVQQFEVLHPDGTLAGRTDWAWPEHGLLGEFDGVGKYARFLRPGETAADAVIREKRREDLLRELTGYRMIRLMWPDLFRRDATERRLRTALRLPL